MQELTASQVKEILEPIPNELFIAGAYYYSEGRQPEKCCSIGHIRKVLSGVEKYDSITPESCALSNTFRNKSERFIRNKYDLESFDIVTVNDSEVVNNYTEPEIKNRVMHLLDDMIKAGL